MQFGSVQFSSVQFSSVQFSSILCSSVQFSSVQFSRRTTVARCSVAIEQLNNNTYKRGEALLRGWVHAHNCIRAEVDKMLFVLERLHTRELAAWEVTAIKDWWKAHSAHIHIHHKIEVGPDRY
jgi:hypothetical protein